MSDQRSISFRETMHGFITFGEDDERRGFHSGRAAYTTLIAHLTVTISDLLRFLADPRHAATIQGIIECDVLGGELPIEGGVFNLFVEDVKPTQTTMHYRIFFRDGVGHAVTLLGVKRIHGNAPAAVWPDTTTLYTRLLRGHIGAEQQGGTASVAAGILRLKPIALLRQLTSFRATLGSRPQRAASVIVFITFFCTRLLRCYVHRSEGEQSASDKLKIERR
jgi:hypothetical protein